MKEVSGDSTTEWSGEWTPETLTRVRIVSTGCMIRSLNAPAHAPASACRKNGVSIVCRRWALSSGFDVRLEEWQH